MQCGDSRDLFVERKTRRSRVAACRVTTVTEVSHQGESAPSIMDGTLWVEHPFLGSLLERVPALVKAKPDARFKTLLSGDRVPVRKAIDA